MSVVKASLRAAEIPQPPKCGKPVKLSAHGTKVLSLIPIHLHPYNLKQSWPFYPSNLIFLTYRVEKEKGSASTAGPFVLFPTHRRLSEKGSAPMNLLPAPATTGVSSLPAQGQKLQTPSSPLPAPGSRLHASSIPLRAAVSERTGAVQRTHPNPVIPPTTCQIAPQRAPVSATCHSPKLPSPNLFGSSHLPQPHPPGVAHL